MDVREPHQGEADQSAIGIEGHLRLLIQTGLLLSSERSLDVIVQAALDAGLALCGAAYGAFFYNTLSPAGEVLQLYKVAGADPYAFSHLPSPRRTQIFAPTFNSEPGGTVRSSDITQDPRYAKNEPFAGMPQGHLQVRSYLAVPVRSLGGEVLGALLYGHPHAGVFRAEAEDLVGTIAAQAAVAIENTRLTERLTREISEADHARAEQRATERRLHQALDAAQLGTWIWTADTGMIDFDDRGAEIFNVLPHVPYSRQKLWQTLILEEDRGETPEDLLSLLDSVGKYTSEYRIKLADGTLRWVAAHGVPIYDDNSERVMGMTGTVQDISPRKNQEESLRQSEKLAATGRLAATIAHEINNPLEAVTNLIYLAKTDSSTPAPVGKLLETADSELARVSQIAQQTLGFYRDTTNPVTIDLNELLGAVVDLFGRKLAIKRLEVKLDLDPGLSITGLQGEIRQVVSNLLVNAIDASSTSGSCIKIRGRHRRCGGRKGVSVLISDQGSGIPTHVRNRLFTPFTTTKQSRGTGLGLWVTRGMVEKHGGSVRFRSRTDDPAGTVFRVFLPKSIQEDTLPSPTPTLIQ